VRSTSNPQIVTRPLISIGASVIAGALIAPTTHPGLVAFAAVGSAALTGVLGWRRRILSTFIAPLPFILVALLIATARLPPRTAAPEGALILEGVVVEEPELRGGEAMTIDRVRTATAADGAWIDREGRVRVRGASCGRLGDEVRVLADLAPIESATVARARSIARRRGVSAEAHASRKGCIVTLPSARIGRSIDTLLAGANRAEALDRLRAAGLEQALSLRGVVLALLFAIGTLIMRGIGAQFPRLALGVGRDRAAAVGGAVVLAALIASLGPTPSILRTAALLVPFLLPHLFGRALDPWSALSLGTIGCILFDPTSLGDTQFQLAFASIAAGIRVHRVGGPWRWLLVLPASVIGTAPLVARSFDRVSLASLASELAAFPLVALASALEVIGAESLARSILRALMALASQIISLGDRAVAFGKPSLYACALFYAALIAISLPRRRARDKIAPPR
jgi:hypothetical protein